MTNKELAKKLNISPATFSMIINNKPGISIETRERVLSELKNMGYDHLIKPDTSFSNAGNLQKALVFLVYFRHGMVLNQHPYFLLLMESIEEQARKFGYYIVMKTIDSKSPNKQESINNINQMYASGVIIFATEMLEEDLQLFYSLNIPYVAIDNDFSHLNINTVSINNELGTHQAIEYLVQQGHTSIGYLHSKDYINSFDEREHGYKNAMLRFGVKLKDEYVYMVHQAEESCFLDMNALLDSGVSLPTAFVCDDDTIAIGALRAFQAHGMNVPEDISIIGFNDRPNASLTKPALTSINVPRYSFGKAAVNAIVALIEDITSDPTAKQRSKKTIIGTQLVVRDSVRRL